MNIRLTYLLLGLWLTVTPNTQASSELPELGSSAGTLMSPKQEQQLGQAFMRSVRRNQAVLDDPLITDYLTQLGHRITQQSSEISNRFHFFVVNNPEINAFAGPGGNIGVYSGLMLTTETESELAAVLAHEVAHVTQRHLMRAWETAGNMALPNAAILLAAIALGVTAGGDAGVAAALGGQAALVQEQINFTRANEQEADRIGIELLAGADFEPRAMPAFFARMAKANRIYASEIPELLLTHPVTTGRTADALGRAEHFPYTQPKDDLRYQLSKISLSLHDVVDNERSIQELQQLLQAGRYRNRSAVEYGLATLLMRTGRLSEADRLLDQLLAKHPEITELIVSKAKLEATLQKSPQALQRLQSALLKRPSSYALNISLAEIAISNREYQLALDTLQTFLIYQDNDPRVYQMLAIAAGENQQLLDSHRYQAQAHYLSGDLESAIIQLELALKLPALSFFDSAKIESQLRAVKKEQAIEKERE